MARCIAIAMRVTAGVVRRHARRARRIRRHHARFFDDARFAPPSERISAAQVFALSDDMRRYVDKEIVPRVQAARPPAGAGRRAVHQGRAQARVRLGDDAQRGRGVRGALRQLPVARHHDRGVRQGARPAARIPEGVRRRRLGARGQHVPCDRPREPHARASARPTSSPMPPAWARSPSKARA